MNRHTAIDLKYTQNFVKNNFLVERLITQCGITNDDFVVEIGTGKGKITRLLAQHAGKVLTFEMDTDLAEKAEKNLAELSNVEVISGDFAEFVQPRGSIYKVFANIPFNQTAQIVNQLLNSKVPPQAAYLFMQKDAAERFIGGPDYRNNQASIIIKSRFNSKIFYRFNRDAFSPIPSVDVVLAAFEIKSPEEVKEAEGFNEFVVFGYNQWSKNALDSFKKIFTQNQLFRLSKDLKISSKTKPSELDYAQWKGMFDFYKVSANNQTKKTVHDFYKKYLVDQKKLSKDHRTRIRG